MVNNQTDDLAMTDILVVDDAAITVQLLMEILGMHGYQVRGVCSGAEALLEVARRPPNLLLLDVMMPHMDGLTVCAKLKQDPATRDIPIIFISALDSSSEKMQAFEAGGVDYITKPFEKLEVLARVRVHIDFAASRQALRAKSDLLEAILGSINQGLVAYDANLRLITCNQNFLDLRDVPKELAVPGTPFAEWVRYDVARQEFGAGDPEALIEEYMARAKSSGKHRVQRTRPNGVVLEIDGGAMPGGGFVSTFTDITEYKKFESALKTNLALMERYLECTGNLVVMLDLQGRVTRFNQATERILNFPAAELMGMLWVQQVVPPEQRERFQSIFANLVSGNAAAPQRYEHEVITRQGERRQILWRSTVLRDCDECIINVIATGVDLSEDRQVAEKLRQIEASYRSLFEHSGDAIMVFNPEKGCYADCNERAVSLFGFTSREALLSASPVKLSPPLQPDGRSSAEKSAANIAHALTVGPHTYDWVSMRQDGTEFSVTVTLSPVFFQGARCVASIKRDISERIRMEKALREKQQRLDFVFDATKDGIWDWDIAQDQVYCSPTYFQILGYDPHEFPPNNGRTFWLDMVHPDDLARTLAETQEHIARSDERYSISFRMRCKDGSYKWILDRGKVVTRDTKGQVTRLVGVHVDIDDFKNLENRLREARMEAERANAAKSEFLATMSHEIRTPMNGILGMAELLNEANLPEPANFHVKHLQQSGKMLLTILNDILDFSKIEAGKLELEEEPFSMAKILAHVSHMFTESANKKGLRFVMNVGATIPEFVLGDALRVQQILTNLLSNAIKFTEQGQVCLTASWNATGAHVGVMHFAVEDTGIGIDAKQFKHLFKAFGQADRSTTRRFGGTGLGLSIINRLVKLMGGGIEVDSTFGAGSQFRVFMPFSVAALPMNDGHEDTVGDICFHAPQEKRILVVDDDEINRAVLLGILENIGFAPEVAINGLEALNLMKAEHFDVVFMDCQMPVMDGFSACRALREEEQTKDWGRTPVVALTAYVLQKDRDKCFAAGMDDYLSKPVSSNSIRHMLARWLPNATKEVGGEKALELNFAENSVLDREVVHQFYVDLEGEIAPVVEIYIKQLPQRVLDVVDAVARRDATLLYQTAHKLKGPSNQLGACRLGKLAERLEHMGMEESFKGAEELVKLLDGEAVAAKEALELVIGSTGQGGE